MLSSLGLCAALACGLALAGPQKTCADYDISITVTSENLILGGLPEFEDNYDVADFLSNLGSRTAAVDFQPVSGIENQTTSYTISATVCSPVDPKAKHRQTVLMATHGLNFDRKYWDPAIQPDKYSFVDFAIERGYSIFFYDRLGVGKSSKVSGYVSQLPNQVAIATKLAQLIKAGKNSPAIGKPKSLVLVGHSYGSLISAATVTAQPDICEGLVLTGFSYNGTNIPVFLQAAEPRIASTQSKKWSSLDSGYLTPVDIFANVNTFFKKPDYDLDVVKYADNHKAPFAVAEFLSAEALDVVPTQFQGKAMVIAGQYDYIFCTGQ
ncbi:uncharacterized protein LTR77_009792 [Saxophila tyrrhenica]|uniref:AB hydrolase-1 domain-containing protein n=1 Tax=Saxophila tyrrhenica TaxID=1690608 RepID=A0AAV9NXA1_9PEZI|nr:hypothetical protein LTR77_009792 [Saxophila tyrrhenica]